MKQRRTRIIRPQPGAGGALSQPELIGQSAGALNSERGRDGRLAVAVFLSGKLKGGTPGGCGWVWGSLKRNHLSPLQLQGLAPSSTQQPQGSLRNANLMCKDHLLVLHCPQEKIQTPRHVRKSMLWILLAPLNFSPTIPLSYSTLPPHCHPLIHSDTCRPLHMPSSILQHSVLHSFIWLTPSHPL